MDPLAGIVVSGKGKGRFFLQQKGYQHRIHSVSGFSPFLGTLNLNVDEKAWALFRQKLVKKTIASFEEKGESFGGFDWFPVRLHANGKSVSAGIIVPHRSTHPDGIIEIVALQELRKSLHLKDGDAVELSVPSEKSFFSQKRIGVVDTMFARANMGQLCVQVLEESGYPIEIFRRTVPGIKDLGVAAKKLIEEEKCATVITLGMVGKAVVDKTCAHEAVQGIQWAQLLTNTHVIDVMVFEEEGNGDDEKLAELMSDRITKHALNALVLVFEPEKLVEKAGTAQRQGSKNSTFFELKKTVL